MRLSRNTIVVFAQETSYGQLPTFDYSTGALLIENGSLTLPHEVETFTPFRKDFGIADIYTHGVHAELSFDLILKGDGVSGDDVLEPQIGKLLQACVFDREQLTDPVSGNTTGWKYDSANLYNPTSVAFEVYVAGNDGNADKYVLVGCYGTFTIRATVGRYPVISFTFTGMLYGSPQTVAIPTVSYPTTRGVPLEGVNFTFSGQNLCVNEITIELGNRVVVKPCMTADNGISGIAITGREPTGSIDPDAVFESDLSLFSLMTNSSDVAMDLSFGSETGNKVSIHAPNVRVREFNFRDRDGIATQEINLTFVQLSGSSELTITFE